MFSTSLLENVWRDLAYGCRLLGRSPGFAAVAIGVLTLGIGANTAIFTLLNAVMLRTLPVRAPHQLVEVVSRFPGEPRAGFSWKVYEHFRDHNHVFSELIGVARARFQLTGDRLDGETVEGEYVVGTFFPALGVEPAIGRLIDARDDQLGTSNAAVVVLSWSYWQNRFNLDPAIVGRPIVVNGVPATVIGVAPRGFFGLQVGVNPAVWAPVAMEPLIQPQSRRANGSLGIGIMGRLQPGVSIEQARAEMRVLDQWRITEIAKSTNAGFARQFTIEVEPGGTGFSHWREPFATPLLILMAGVGVLLLIACTNLASLLLARGAARQREIAVRVSLGAGRSRIVGQLMTESVLLAATGSVLGVGLAYVAAGALVGTIQSGRMLPGIQQLRIEVVPDAQVLLFTAVVAVATAVLCGLAPAWSAFTAAPASSLRATGTAGETPSTRLFGKSLVVAQVALSIVLLSAAGLFVRHLSHLRHVGVGFERDSVLLMTLDPARSGYDSARLAGMYQQLLARLQAIPGVLTATLSAVTPIQGAGASRFVNVDGFGEEPETRRYVSLNWVAPRYFETLGTPLLAGRDFVFEDEGRAPVAIVNQAMAAYYFGSSSPLGRQFTFEGRTASYEIVGVVADAKYQELREAAPRTIYMNAFQEERGRFSQFALRTSGTPTALVSEVRRTVGEVLASVPVAKVTTLADQADASIVPERLVAALSALFALLGAALAAVGLYGLLAYTVSRRTNEIGIRMALGASERAVTRMVLKSAAGLLLAGLAAGAPLAVWSRRVAASMVVNLPVESAVPIGVACAAMIALALLAAYLPARRAARVNPVDALRQP